MAAIAYSPVKGLALASVDEVELESSGIRDNRRFHVVGPDGRLVNGKAVGPLVQVAATSDHDATFLSLRFPDGSVVAGPVEPGDAIESRFGSRAVPGRVAGGDFSEALSAFAGQPLTLVRVDEPGLGNDRGLEGSVSLVSLTALDTLAREADVGAVDGRRFRMLFSLAGIGPHAEDGWIGGRVAIGGAVVRLNGLVGRCAVTTQDPSTGIRDLDTLRILKRYRPNLEGEEPIPFGVWGEVEQPGRVRVGDPALPL